MGITRRQLTTWKQHPEFTARIEELARELGEVTRRYAITKRIRRMKGYDERRARMLKLIEERAEEHADAPGGDTGLLVKTTKSIGGGPAAQVVDEYAADLGLLKELRELEKQAAIEAGQWSEKQEHTGKDGGPMIVQWDLLYERSPITDPVDEELGK